MTITDGLRNKALRGLFWSFLERIGQQGVQFVISIILARLLMPEEFGLIAMLMIFVAVAKSFVDGGFASALIHKKNTTNLDECSIFYFNIFLGAAMAVSLCLVAPWIAEFYDRPVLTPLVRVLSLNLLIGAFGIVQTALLTKRIDFKTQMKVSMLATFLSGILGVTMAYRGFGVWSLVAQSLSSNLFRTSLLWVFNDWRPTWVFSFASLQSMFSFGSKLFFSNLLNIVFGNLHVIVIGKVYSAADLGFYSRAKFLQELPVSSTSDVVSRVTFPVFSSVQDDNDRLTHGMRQALTMLAMLNFPMMIGLAVVAEPLVLVLLTEKWLPSVPYVQLFCAVGMLYPLHLINLNVLKAKGRSDLFLRIEVIKKIMTVVAVSITYRWGIAAMISGEIVVSFLSYYLNCNYSSKLLNYSMTQQIREVLPSFVLASVMGGSIYLLHYASFPNQFVLLASQVVLGGVLYIFLCWLFKLSPFLKLVEITKQKLSKVP